MHEARVPRATCVREGRRSSRSSCRRDGRVRRRAHAATVAGDARRAPRSIYQATFARDGWRGRADFVVRVDEPSDLGAWSYEPYDTKLARSARSRPRCSSSPGTRTRSRRIQGRLPERLHVVLGHGRDRDATGRPTSTRTSARAQTRLRAHVEQPPETYPWPCEHCSRCDFIVRLSRALGGRRPPDARRLDPARPDREARDRSSVDDARPRSRESPAGARRAAARAADARAAARPGGAPAPRAARRASSRATCSSRRSERGFGLLPPPSPGDVFFDMEGDPFFEPAARARVPLRRALARAGRRRRRTARSGRTTATGERARVRAVRRLRRRAAPRVPRPARLPLRRLRALDARAADGRARDARGGGRRAAPRRGASSTCSRSSARASAPACRSYSLKDDREAVLHADGGGRAPGNDGGDRVRALARRPATSRCSTTIEAYNEEDCRATLELRDWLLEPAARGRGASTASRSRSGRRPEPREPREDDERAGRDRAAPRRAARAARGGRRARAAGAAARLPPARGAARRGGGTSAGSR